jgi:cytochrome c oxidase subunit 3
VNEQAPSIDVSELPSYAFGPRGILWWGTLWMMAIEGTVFAMAIASYFYLYVHAPRWPLSSAPPDLLWGTLNTLVLLLSLWPNHWLKRAASAQDLRGVRRAIGVLFLFTAAFLALRGFEFAYLNVRWDFDVYGSVVWLLLGLHTTHLVTEAYDTWVIGALSVTGPFEGRRFVDAAEDADYWYFVVFTWLPIYGVIYWAPRGGT